MGWPPDTLVLSSGGLRGTAHVGAVRVLDRAGVLRRVRRYVGTSAGAFVCMLLALDYTPGEVERLAREFDVASMLDRGSVAPLEAVARLPTRYGLLCSETGTLARCLRTLVARSRVAGGDPGLTFGELGGIRGGDRRRDRDGTLFRTSAPSSSMPTRTPPPDLVVCATDVRTGRAVYFSAAATPDAVVAEAVAASCAVPFVLTPVHGVYADGALVDHYPVGRAAEDSERYVGVLIVDDCHGSDADSDDDEESDDDADADADDDDADSDDAADRGSRVSSSSPPPSASPPTHGPRHRQIESIVSYARSLVRSVEGSMAAPHLRDPDTMHRTIVVRCARRGLDISGLSAHTEAGARAARAFLRRRGLLAASAEATAAAATEGEGGEDGSNEGESMTTTAAAGDVPSSSATSSPSTVAEGAADGSSDEGTRVGEGAADDGP